MYLNQRTSKNLNVISRPCRILENLLRKVNITVSSDNCELRFFYFLRCQRFAAVDLTEILEKHIFVGIVDLDRCLSLLQHSTKLYLVNHGALAYGSTTPQ